MLNEKVFVTAIVAFLILGGISIYVNQTNINDNTEQLNKAMILGQHILNNTDDKFTLVSNNTNEKFKLLDVKINNLNDKMDIILKSLLDNKTE